MNEWTRLFILGLSGPWSSQNAYSSLRKLYETGAEDKNGACSNLSTLYGTGDDDMTW